MRERWDTRERHNIEEGHFRDREIEEVHMREIDDVHIRERDRGGTQIEGVRDT